MVCIGQLEAHIHDNNYLEYPEESGLSGTALEEELELKISSDKVEIKTENTTPVDVNEEDDIITIGIGEDATEDKIKPPVRPESEDNKTAAEPGEPFEYFVDFDEPDLSQPKLTDEDLYN